MKQTVDRPSQSIDELVEMLDCTIDSGKGWIESMPPRGEDETPPVNAAKQLTEEACEFATTISDAIKRDHTKSAYANLRLLLDRFLCAARFFEFPADLVPWAYWSMAELNQLASDSMSQGAVNPQDVYPMRHLLRHFRHWNRSESGQDRQLFKPSRYEWNDIRREIIDESNPLLKTAYGVTSTYVHPTYRGSNSPELTRRYLLEQTVLITCSTIIICGASSIPFEENRSPNQVNPNLVDTLDTLNVFLTGNIDLAGVIRNPPGSAGGAQVLYLYGAMLVKFVFGRDVIAGQPQLVGT